MSQASIALASGDKLPSVGLGMWKIAGADAARIVVEAAECGYRHFDCACDYGNEPSVGQGLQRVVTSSVCGRDEMWVTSQLWNTYHRREHVRAAAERSLTDLRLDYLDLYLIHFPIAQRFVPFETRYPPEWLFDPQAERMRENLALFDFELESAEVEAISGLNRDRRFNDPGVFCESAFNTFLPIYE